ncbi:MAG: exo-alpha-sialidase [Planctomycetes bacterium]|nr:exo-alpha-sialidase [Planctomycetota bacterium]
MARLRPRGRRRGGQGRGRLRRLRQRPGDRGVILAALLLSQTVDVFVSGQDGYHTFRIPSAVVTTKGTLLAFCEGRVKARGDSGDIDLVLRRSSDGGATWGPLQVVWNDGANTCGNPCPVVDRETGTVWLLMTHNLGEDPESKIIDRTARGTRTIWVTKSADDGATWSAPVDLTKDLKKPEWTWVATGPGVGIQTKNGRLVVPCDHVEAETKKGGSHVIWSADHGAGWTLGGGITGGVNECQVVERADGSLLLNMRNYGTAARERAVASSADGGATWSALGHDAALVEPACQASLLRYSWDPSLILFSNPADRKSRIRLTIRSSRDEGATWTTLKEFGEAPAAYSCLAPLADRKVGCFYETGVKSAYERIVFARIALD